MLVDRQGTPLAIWLTPANVHDGQLLTALVDAVEPIHRPRGQAGRPRKRPNKLHADKAYSSRANRRALRERGITPRIARPCIESSERLGRFRRLAIRYERRADIHLAFLDLGCALLCFATLQHVGCCQAPQLVIELAASA